MIDDVITVVASIGFCIDGPTLDEEKFDNQFKLFFTVFKETLEDEAFKD